jgi:hypothetical protein
MSRKKKSPTPGAPAYVFNPNAAEERKEREEKLLRSAGYVKAPLEELARLEAKADEILAKDHADLIAEVKRNTELIEQIYKDLRQPSNDPAYLEKLQRVEQVRNNLANKITLLHLVPDKDKLWISAAFSHADGETCARLMAEHFEASVQRYDETTQ